MNRLRVMVLGCVAVVLAAAPAPAKDKDESKKAPAGKVQELILGKWEASREVNKKKVAVTMTFRKDNTIRGMLADVPFEGTYRFLKDNEMEMTLTLMGKTDTEKVKVEVSEEELVLTPPKGQPDKFKRVK